MCDPEKQAKSFRPGFAAPSVYLLADRGERKSKVSMGCYREPQIR